jgi:cell division protein FtsZ
VIRAASDDNTNIIFGASVDERLAGQMWVTVVATGFALPGESRRPRQQPAADRLETPPPATPPDLNPPDFLRGE